MSPKTWVGNSSLQGPLSQSERDSTPVRTQPDLPVTHHVTIDLAQRQFGVKEKFTSSGHFSSPHRG